MPYGDSPYATPAVSVGLPFTGSKLEDRPSLSEEEEARAYSDRCGICQWTLSFKRQYATKRCSACRNVFHPRCLSEWYRGSNARTCPLCNHEESKGRRAQEKHMSTEETLAPEDAQRATAPAPSFFPNAGYEEPLRREQRRAGPRQDGTEQDMKIRARVNWGDLEPELRGNDESPTRTEPEHSSLYDPDRSRQTRIGRQRATRQQNAYIASTEAAWLSSRSSDVDSQLSQPRRSNALSLPRADSPPRRKPRRQDDEIPASTEFRKGDSRRYPLLPGEEHHGKKLAYVERQYSASNGSDPFARWYSRNSSAGSLFGETPRSKTKRDSMDRSTNRGRRRVLRDTIDQFNAREKRLAEGADRSTPSRSSEWQAAMPVMPSTISRDNTVDAESQQRALLMRVLR